MEDVLLAYNIDIEVCYSGNRLDRELPFILGFSIYTFLGSKWYCRVTAFAQKVIGLGCTRFWPLPLKTHTMAHPLTLNVQMRTHNLL